MFKIESYITPIILSYVDKYIKNFRPEDSQFSLWGGDVSFNNLDLRLEVLEQELQLPFSFVSGHIHELLIHVPWTKITSEPITITINTIECILKLRTDDGENAESYTKERPRKVIKDRKEMVTPPGYIQTLVNKIVSNIKIYCNNLILKYVEEDIVLSMNVKLLTFESANAKWEAAYTDVSPSEVILRKLITVNDLTICLDKRNASGKIEVYQEPMLYRCSLVIHLLFHYHSATVKKSSNTRVDISCSNMEFSVTEQQVPMVMRLIMLIQALQAKELRFGNNSNQETDSNLAETSDAAENVESWAGWAWSFVPSILPTQNLDDWTKERQMALAGHALHVGLFVDNLSLTFKVSESSTERGYYQQKKLKYWPLLTVQLQGLFCEVVMLGKKWAHAAFGISEIVLKPVGYCSCSFPDGDLPKEEEYLRAGNQTTNYKADSLFDVEAVENKGQRRIYNISWDYHVETTNEATLLDRTPAFAMDYLYHLEIPDDMSSERLSELGSDLEYSNLSEKSLIRFVIGPFRLKLCSGFLHRLSSLQAASSLYEYSPYSCEQVIPTLEELLPPSEDDYDALNEIIPMKTFQITILAPVVEIQLMDHPHFEATKGHFFKKRKKSTIQPKPILTSTSDTTSNIPFLPKFTIECQCIDIKITQPMYTKRLIQTTCQLPNPPKIMFDACHYDLHVKVLNMCSRLLLDNNRQTTVLTMNNASFHQKRIIQPLYWINPDVAHSSVELDIESITVTGSNPKINLMYQILYKFIQQDCGANDILNSSLIPEASKDYGMAYLEFCIEAFNFKKVGTCTTNTINLSLGSIKSFIFNPVMIYNSNDAASNFYSTREIQQVLFISGPELKQGKQRKEGKEEPLLSAVIQFPLEPDNDQHPPILLFTLQEIRICVDPLLCKWLLYRPVYYNKSESNSTIDSLQKKMRLSDTSLTETPRRSGTPHESIHSSTDIDQLFLPSRQNRPSKEEEIDVQEKIYEFLKKWFKVWKGMLICGDISQCTIYFPVQSLSAIGSQGIQEAVEEAMTKEQPPEILVITLPFATIRSAAQRYNVYKYINTLPVNLPENIWSKEKPSFPWTISISDLGCYTIQFGKKFDFLKPVSLNATVGLSTKSSKVDVPDLKKDSSFQEKMANVKQSSVSSNEGMMSSPSISKPDIDTLGVCVHIDMTPIDVTMSEVQICLITSILYGLTEVTFNLTPESSNVPATVINVLPPITGQSTTMSPTIIKESTIDSVSEETPQMSVNVDNIQTDNVKLTAWIQWTVTRFSAAILSHNAKELLNTTMGYTRRPTLKLLFEAEDIVSSVDFQNVFLKMKSKIGSASIQHFQRDLVTGKWKPGPYLGFVMRSVEETHNLEKQEDNSFANITITRAQCKHTHNLWGASNKNKFKDKNDHSPPVSRYITEIVLILQPIDIVLSLNTLQSFYMVIEPLLRIPSNAPKKPVKQQKSNLHVNSKNLPLAYIEWRGFRIIIPSDELRETQFSHNVLMFQIESIHLNPNPENPICRNPCRPDIYRQAAQARILNIPGSELEDRQYQLDITGISMNTGKWEEFVPILQNQRISNSQLKTMSENPALEWNYLGKRLGLAPEVKLWPIISKFNIYFIAAPAMMYKQDVICGHSLELNFISDIHVTIALSQLKLISYLTNEFVSMFDIPIPEDVARPQVVFPYSIYTPKNLLLSNTNKLDVVQDMVRDSGFETPDWISHMSTKTKESYQVGTMKKIPEAEVTTNTIQKVSTNLTTVTSVPLEVLITSGKVSCLLYESGNEFDKRLIHYKHKKHKTKVKKNEDKGYEASEESSLDENNDDQNKIQPLLYASLSQPNAFLSQGKIETKLQISCFDISLKLCGSEYKKIVTIPTKNDFPIDLLETKSGEPHPDTGILPAFLTFRWIKGLGTGSNLDIEIAKPTKITLSLATYSYLMDIQQKLFQQFVCNDSNCVNKVEQNITQFNPERKQLQTYNHFKTIKELFGGINIVNVKLNQIVLSFQTNKGSELNLSIGKLTNILTISNRPDKLVNLITIDCLSAGVVGESSCRLLLNPWSFSIETCLFWEAWQSTDSNPQVHITMESESLRIDISPSQINCVKTAVKEIMEFVSYFSSESKETDNGAEDNNEVFNDVDQHYKDDLRAGAFQFVDSTSNNVDELPLPYQVMFWNKKILAMAWRYPQPRSLTKVRVFPVPFKSTSSHDLSDQQLLCHLEYWSDCHGSYQPYTQFYISESEMCHLELPKCEPQPAVACTWRVLLSVSDSNQRSKIAISPRALAGCIRVDSYFNKSLIPDLNISLIVNSVDISLYNYFNKSKEYRMPESLDDYICDMAFPESQCFLTISLNNNRAYLSTWKFKMFSFDLNTGIKCNVLDYNYLTNLEFIEQSRAKLCVNISKNVNVNVVANPIHARFGSSIAHTLLVSGQLWGQSTTEGLEKELVILTHYVICNDTNVNIKFGQSGNEEIYLPSRYCHLYTWRSQKYKQVLRVALEDNGWVWSEHFKIDQEGTEVLHLSEKNMNLIVTVKNLSVTQKKVTFSGQLVITNMLMDHFELKVVEESQRKKEFKNLTSYIINGRSTPPSLLLDIKRKYFLRIRFYGLESAWSGDIPLVKNTKCAQPWLVKVPLQERGQFLSIWCRIITQHLTGGKKILVVMWPLFMIRSNLPINSKVKIETPTLNVHVESTIRGKGEYQQLYCPGTIDHSHQLSFQLETGLSTSNPYVPLNYSLVDQKEFFKKPKTIDIDEILEVLKNYDKSDWPYFGEELDNSELVINDQPLTHVQVHYQKACEHSSALLVELLPWCLLLNTLGCSIALFMNEKELCTVNHHGIVTPPKLEDTFHIGVGIGKTWSMSPILQLHKPDWSQTFYMPKITGTIPIDGNIKIVVHLGANLCMISIMSSIVNEIRLLKVCSSHVISNYMSVQLYAVCVAIPVNKTGHEIPSNLEKYSFTIAPHQNKSNAGIPIIQWLGVGKDIDSLEQYSDFALYILFSLNPKYGWSCPVRVDGNMVRRSLTLPKEDTSISFVVISEKHKGQHYLFVHHDSQPQMLITNKTDVKLFCAQHSITDEVTVAETTHFKWICGIDSSSSSYYTMPALSENFPELSQVQPELLLVLATDPEGDPIGFQWSIPISLQNYNDQFVRIPFYGDVKVAIVNSSHSIYVTLQSVSEVEISARDIRVRLSLQESETADNEDDKESISSGTLGGTMYYSAEENEDGESKSLVSYKQKNRSKTPTSVYKKTISDFNIREDSSKQQDVKISVFLQCMIVTLTDDSSNGSTERVEVACLTCENIGMTINQSDVTYVTMSTTAFQIDNQMFNSGSFDFPVVFIGQVPFQNNISNIFSTSISKLTYTSQANALISTSFTLDSWLDKTLQSTITGVKDIHVVIKPLSTYIEDVFVSKIVDLLKVLTPTSLVLWPQSKKNVNNLAKGMVHVPLTVIWTSLSLAKPVVIQNLVIEPVSISLSVHYSIKVYIALDQSPLQFGKFERKNILTTPYRLGHSLTMHYVSGAIFGAGWVVGSLELLGSPGGLARAMGIGLRDFVSLPYSGLWHGPWAFLTGVTHGTTSLMKHITAGTVQSITKLASSVARNLDRLTLDQEHLKRTEEARRQRPQGFREGFMQGLTGLGISLLGAVGGIAHHPLQSVLAEPSARSIVSGVGLGIVGIFTKPFSAAAELVALSGQGFLQGAGWSTLPEIKMKPVLNHIYSGENSLLKFYWKYSQMVTESNILFVTEATSISNMNQYESVHLILTLDALIIANSDEDAVERILCLSELTGLGCSSDPTLLTLKLSPPKFEPKIEGEVLIEMDPVSRARVADYVRNTTGFVHIPDDETERSMSISPDLDDVQQEAGLSEQVMTFYMNAQCRSYFLCLMSLAKKQTQNYNFPVF